MPTPLTANRQSNRPWPFLLPSAERDPQLSEAEQTALAALVERGRVTRTAAQKLLHPLQRFYRPIQLALQHGGYELNVERVRAGALLLYYEMHQRQRSFWAWNEADWLEVVGQTVQLFKARHHVFLATHRLVHTHFRQCVLACAYLLGEVPIYQLVTGIHPLVAAQRIFGGPPVQAAVAAVLAESRRLGRGRTSHQRGYGVMVSLALLRNRSPLLETLTLPVFEQLYQSAPLGLSLRRACVLLTQVLHSLGILPQHLAFGRVPLAVQTGMEDTLSSEWAAWIQRWYATSTVSLATRNERRVLVAKAGRWATAHYPNTASPEQWTAEMALAYVAAVNQLTVGEWNHPKTKRSPHQVGKPLRPSAKAHLLSGIRAFFLDCQDWHWLPRTFSPQRCLATPRSITALRGPDPRVLADDWWAKLLSAGLLLTAADLPVPAAPAPGRKHIKRDTYYPLEMVRALVIVWLFAGLRADEIRRLRVGCARWQTPAGSRPANELPAATPVCLLSVPINKTSTAFVKPVDYLVGEVIAAWEKVRPDGPTQWDVKTGEAVQFLFRWRGLPIGRTYLNHTLIPMLCRKAGLPEADARGVITSHRARATIATQLFNAREPMTLFELQEWLGHRSPHATQYYAKLTPTKLTKAYTDAGYFSRNVRLIELLVDQEAIRNGAAATGQPWLYYDLSHGYCTYDYFDQCPHRMACAKCSFYLPKESSYVHLLEAKANLLRLQQTIPLSEEERAAVEDGLNALEKLTARLQDIPTPQGLTPRELHSG